MLNFCTFEGADGTGKSTQARLLFKNFNDANIPVLLTREPGGSPLAEQIRELIINEDMSLTTQFFLFLAARRDHVENTIEPAIKAGKIVICDRYIDSTRVYQAHIATKIMHDESEYLATAQMRPDLTFIMDMDAEESIRRLDMRGNKNSFDNQPLDFHKANRERFLKIAKNNPERCIVINANQDVDKVHREILDHVLVEMIKPR